MTQRKNVEMGYYAGGTFHPIRASGDYDTERGGDDYDWRNKRTPGSKALRQRLRKNVEMGFYAGGTFHPIRASRDYSYSAAGEHDTGKTSQLRSIDAAIRKRDQRRAQARNPAMPVDSKTPNATKPLSPQTRKLAAILGVRIAKEGRGYKYHTPLGVFSSLTAAAEALQGSTPVKKNPRTETYAEQYNRHLLALRDGKSTKRNTQQLFTVGALLGKTNLEMQRDIDKTENARLRFAQNPPPKKKNFLPAALAALGTVRELRSKKNPAPDTGQHARAYRDILNALDKVQTTGKCSSAQRAELERLAPLSNWNNWDFDKEIAERQKRYANDWVNELLARIRQTGNYTSREAEQLKQIAAQHGVDWVTAQGWLIDAYAHWHKNMPQQTNPGRLSKVAGKLTKAARILSAAQTLRDELRRTKPNKKRNPEVAEAVEQVYEMFQGRPASEHNIAAAPDGTPDDLAQLGTLSYLKVKRNGVIRTWKFTDVNAPLLCADSDGNLYIVGNVITQEPAGDMGEIILIGYITHKDHIGDAQEFDFRHKFGEQGGQPPHLVIDAEGFFHIVGGDYRLQAEGIVD